MVPAGFAVLLVGGVTGMIGEAVVTMAAVQVGYLLGVLVAAQGTLALQQTASLFDDLVDRHVIDLDAGQLIFDRNHELDTVKSIGAEVIPEA
jgi:hypothetical protein